LRGNRKDSSQIALNIDLHLAVHRRQNNLVHQGADGIGGFDPPPFVLVLEWPAAGFVDTAIRCLTELESG
jgi:hypothetical protein